MTNQYMDRLLNKIEYMSNKCKKDPSWINNMILECMLADYEAKMKLKIKDDGQTSKIY